MIQLLAFLFPVIVGTLSGLLPLHDSKLHRLVCTLIMIVSDMLGVMAMFRGTYVELFHFTDKAVIAFGIDDFGRFALTAVLILYTCVCFYAFTYMQHEERPQMFFAFFFISLGAMMAVCMSADMVSLYFCFELATLSSMPLVLHQMSKEAVSAGLKYLFYSMAGALMGLLAVFYVYTCAAGEVTFRYGGFLDSKMIAGHEHLTLAVILIGIIGFGTKAGMYPMHGWLPTAHPIAPAPASSLLSGIIAKAGVIAVIRLVYYCTGPDLLRGTWVQTVWMSLALLTVLMGSTMAFREKVIKKRLAYSTISQISYIMFSLSLLTEDGLKGGLLQMISHMGAKGCLFLAAGVFIFVLDAHRVDELKGIGRALPVTMWCFMIASLSLVGIPPMGGFVSKWKIASAALSGGPGIFAILGPVILLISALLTAGYLFPVVIDAFFPGAESTEHAAKNMVISAASQSAGKNIVLSAGDDNADRDSDFFSGGDENADTDSDFFSAGDENADLDSAFFSAGGHDAEYGEEETGETEAEDKMTFSEPGVLVDGAMIILCAVALLAGLFGAGIVGGLAL